MMFMHLDEIRDAAVKAGWHTEEAYKALEFEHIQLLAEKDALVQKVMDLEKKSEDLVAALGWKPDSDPVQEAQKLHETDRLSPKVAKKPAAKKAVASK